MREDEIRHGMAASDAGARELPLPLRVLMRATAKLMTLTAYRV
jgi:ubiquinone biosynthesis monooxygenase Coq7